MQHTHTIQRRQNTHTRCRITNYVLLVQILFEILQSHLYQNVVVVRSIRTHNRFFVAKHVNEMNKLQLNAIQIFLLCNASDLYTLFVYWCAYQTIASNTQTQILIL